MSNTSVVSQARCPSRRSMHHPRWLHTTTQNPLRATAMTKRGGSSTEKSHIQAREACQWTIEGSRWPVSLPRLTPLGGGVETHRISSTLEYLGVASGNCPGPEALGEIGERLWSLVQTQRVRSGAPRIQKGKSSAWQTQGKANAGHAPSSVSEY